MKNLRLDVEINDDGTIRIGTPTAFSTNWWVTTSPWRRIGDVLQEVQKARSTPKADVHVYASSLAVASVCVPDTMCRRAVEQAVNEKLPTGINSQWAISEDPQFRTGEPNPCPCEQDSNRRHYLLNC